MEKKGEKTASGGKQSFKSLIMDVLPKSEFPEGERYPSNHKKQQQYHPEELSDGALLLVFPTKESALEASQRSIQSILNAGSRATP